jgi:hypothetical protein
VKAVGATVNDAVLVAVTALHDLLGSRGEAVDPIAAGVPVSRRRATTSARLGNQVAPILVPTPVTVDIPQRPARVARTVRTGAKSTTTATGATSASCSASPSFLRPGGSGSAVPRRGRSRR